jgi:hypothetical protein
MIYSSYYMIYEDFILEPVTISYTHYWVHWFLPVKYPTCKNCLNWDIFHYFYFFTKYIALLSLIVKKWSLHISYNMKNISLSFCSRRLFSFIDLFPPYFIKLCQNIHPKTPLKSNFSIWAGPNTFTFWSANFQMLVFTTAGCFSAFENTEWSSDIVCLEITRIHLKLSKNYNWHKFCINNSINSPIYWCFTQLIHTDMNVNTKVIIFWLE